MNENKYQNLDIEFENDDFFKLNDNYTILLNKKIGSGSFGQIYQCLNRKTNESTYKSYRRKRYSYNGYWRTM